MEFHSVFQYGSWSRSSWLVRQGPQIDNSSRLARSSDSTLSLSSVILRAFGHTSVVGLPEFHDGSRMYGLWTVREIARIIRERK